LIIINLGRRSKIVLQTVSISFSVMDMLEYTAVPEADRPAKKVLDLPAGRQGATLV
jgi:hypothetical protein